MNQKKYTTVSGEVKISKPVSQVFAFVSNFENDHQWRKEIITTQTKGPRGIGCSVDELSYLSKKEPSHLLQLICKSYRDNQSIVFETTAQSDFYLLSERSVEPMNNDQTLFHYKISFARDLVTFALGFRIPDFLIDFGARRDMRKYLAKLKQVLENKTL